jgi:TusA-related sulfurtransferase
MQKKILDITKEHCPMTFVKTKLELEKLNKGEILEVVLKKGEPLENVPSSAEEQGYIVKEIIQMDEEKYKVIILR